MTPLVDVVARPRRLARGLLAATALCWLLGVPGALSGWALVVVTATRGTGDLDLLVMGGSLGVAATALCYGGYELWRGRQVGGRVALGAAAALIALHVYFSQGGLTLGMIGYVTIIALVLRQWRRLNPANAAAGR